MSGVVTLLMIGAHVVVLTGNENHGGYTDTVKVRSDRSRGGASGMVAAAPAEQQMQMVRQDVT